MAAFMHIYGDAVDYPEKGKVPAFLVFGDSIVDPGNNNNLFTVIKANFPPYGRDFVGGAATGRFSNGKIPSDFFAEELGIKEFTPAYMDPNLTISDLLTGVSFGSGGAGYDPSSAKLANAMTLEDQLKLFKGYINKLKAAIGENKTSTIISDSIYAICAGSNDITNTYYTLPFARLKYNISTYTDLMVNWSSSFVQELYGLGARRIGVISAPSCGCLPAQRTLHGGLSRSCSKDENQAALLFNKKLFSELGSLKQKLVGSKLVYLDIYNPLLNLINNPSQSGFKIVNKGCCGTGNLEVAILCNKLDDLTTCTDVSKYLFWDSYHPTEVAYKLIVHEILQKRFKVVNRGCCGTGIIEGAILCNKLVLATCKDASKYLFWDSYHPTEIAYKLIVHEIVQKNIADFF